MTALSSLWRHDSADRLLDLTPEAVMEDINERALDLTGELAREADSERITVQAGVLS